MGKAALYLRKRRPRQKGRGDPVRRSPFPRLVKGVLDAVRREDGLFPILCGAENAYVENDEEPFFSRAREPYTNCFKVKDLDDYIDAEPVCKISVFDPQGARGHAMKVLPALNGAKLTLSGEHWCDVAAPDADKGNAIRAICRTLGISAEECMAFGDHMNDEGMLRALRTSPRPWPTPCPSSGNLRKRSSPPTPRAASLSSLRALLGKNEV